LPAIPGYIYIDPKDLGSLTAALERVIGDENPRTTLKAKGRVRAGEFSWEKTAKMTHAVDIRSNLLPFKDENVTFIIVLYQKLFFPPEDDRLQIAG